MRRGRAYPQERDGIVPGPGASAWRPRGRNRFWDRPIWLPWTPRAVRRRHPSGGCPDRWTCGPASCRETYSGPYYRRGRLKRAVLDHTASGSGTPAPPSGFTMGPGLMAQVPRRLKLATVSLLEELAQPAFRSRAEEDRLRRRGPCHGSRQAGLHPSGCRGAASRPPRAGRCPRSTNARRRRRGLPCGTRRAARCPAGVSPPAAFE